MASAMCALAAPGQVGHFPSYGVRMSEMAWRSTDEATLQRGGALDRANCAYVEQALFFQINRILVG
jgi:hypothetical protein